MADGKVNVEIVGNTSGLDGASKKAVADLKSISDAADSTGKKASTSLENVDKAASKLSSTTSKTGSAVKTLESAATSGAGSLKNTASAAAQTESKFASMASQSAKAALGVTGFGNGLASLVNPMGLAATATVGLGLHAVGMAGDFEEAMARLQVMTGVTDKSSDSFKQLQAAAIKVGEDTKFSGQEAAEGMSDLAAAGLNVKDTIAAINPVAQAAMINQVGISDAAKVATVSMNAFGLKAGDVGKIIDVTTTAANLGVLQFQDFGNAMAAVGSVAKLSNQSLTDVTSALIALTNNGQSAQDAGTSIKSALLALTNPSAEAAAAMKELGINVFDAQGKMRPFSEIVRQIEVGTKGMTEAQRNQLLATVAGSDGIRAFSGALGATITVQRDGKEVTLQGSAALNEFQRQLDNSGGAAKRAADVLENTFNAKLEQTKGKVDELVRKLGEKLIPIFKFAIETLDDAVDRASSDNPFGNNLSNNARAVEDFADQSRKAADAVDKVARSATPAVKAFTDFGNSVKVSSTGLQTYIQDNIATRKAIQENLKASELYAKQLEQTYAQSEYNRKKLQALNEEIDYNGKSFATLSAPMQAIAGKYGDLTGKVNTLSIAIEHLNSVNDELNGKIGENNQLINTMSMGVDQLALKHGNAKIVFDGTNHTLQEGYDQWVKYTEIQAAGGDGATDAGKKAGDLAKQLTGVDKSFQPLLDTTFNAINQNSKYKDSVVANTEAAAKNQLAIDNLTPAARKLDDAFEDAAVKARAHGGALNVSADGAANAKQATDKATGAIKDYNQTPVQEKQFKSNVQTMSDQVKALLDSIFKFNATPIQNKTATISTVWTGSNGAYGPALPSAPAPSGGGGGGSGGAKPNATGLSTAMGVGEFGGGKNAGNFGVLAQAAQQAVVANFSLASLKDNIDQIVKMFREIDSKALAAAANQAESVSKIASAASGMVDLFGKLETYTHIGRELMIQVAKDSAEMTKDYMAGAALFNVKALEGAATYIDTSGKVASAASSMVDVLGKLVGYKGPIRDAISGFTGNVKDVTFDFVEYSRIFTKDSLDGAATYIDTAGKVGSAMSGLADGLLKVKDWSGLARESIAGFAGNVKDIVYDFSQYAPQFNEDTLKQSVAYAEGTGKIGSAISSMADGLVKIKDWSGIGRESMAGFAGNVKDITFDFSEYGKLFNEVSLKTASDFADAAGKVTSIIAAAVAGLAALKDYAGLNRANMSLFGSDMVEAVNSFQSAGLLFKSEGLKSATDFADTGGKVTGIISTAVQGFQSLDEYRGVAAGSLSTFMGDLTTTVRDFQAAAEGFKPEVTAATAAFAESAGKITDGLGKGIDFFTKLADYKGVPQQIMGVFLGDVRTTINLVSRMVAEMDSDMLPQVAQFGVASGQVFDGLSKGLTLFKGLEVYKSIPTKVITDLMEEIKFVVIKMADLKDTMRIDLLDKAKTFAKAVDEIFSKLKGAVDVFKQLETYKDDTTKAMDALLNGIVAALAKMAQLEGKAEELYEGAVRYAKKMADAAAEIAKGNAAWNGTTGPGGGGDTTNSFDKYNPGSGGNGGPRGYALGGLVSKSGTYRVGEFGPETVWLPGGARVESNMSSGSATGGGGSRIVQTGSHYYTIQVVQQPGQSTDKLADELLKKIQQKQRQNQVAGYSPNRGY